MELKVKDGKSKFNDKKPTDRSSCFKCGHFAVCAVFKAICPVMSEWPTAEEVSEVSSSDKIMDIPIPTRAFEAADIAIICQKYAEAFVVIPKRSEVESDDY